MRRERLRLFGAAFAFVALVFAPPARAQDWLAKPFQEWSRGEAAKVLEESPWAVKQTVKIKYAEQSRRVAGAPGAGSTAVAVFGGEPTLVQPGANTAAVAGATAPVDFTFTLRLRSGLPLRKALARLKQLEAGRLSEKERASAEAKVKGLLECPACADNYVLTLSAKSKEIPGADPVHASFKGARINDLKRYIFIANERGERRPLVHFVPPTAPGDEAIFFFPRADESGRPLLTPANKLLLFNAADNEVNSPANFRVDVTKLVVNGVLEF